MCIQRPRLKVLIANIIAAIIAILVFGMATSDAKTPPPSPFLSPTSLTPRIWLPIVMNNFPPNPTISRYVGYSNLISRTVMYNLGCNRGQTVSPGQNVIVVIDFGYPAYDGASAQYGAKSLNDHIFHSTTEIVDAAEGFLGGFYLCSPTGISLTLAIGINNYLYDPNGVTQQHGAAWGQAVTALNTWINSPPSFADKLITWGGIDAEIPWNTAAATRSWVDGYKSTFNSYVDFGSCDGCPYFAHPDWVPAWSLEDIWYIAFGATPASPLPEIYTVNGSNADQWYRMSVYAYTNHSGTAMKFKGAMTQWNACQEQTDPNWCANNGLDNLPSQGYMQLYTAVNADPRTKQQIPWSTDISWQK